MTYIIALRTKEGFLIASDGLSEYKNSKRETVSLGHESPKIFNLTDYSVIGFAGAVTPDIEAHVERLKGVIGQHVTTNSQFIAEVAGYSTMRDFAPILMRQGSDLEMLVVAYDSDSKGKPTVPKTYFMKYSKGEKIHVVNTGYFEIGYAKGIRDKIEQLYIKSHKGYKSLKKIAIKAVRTSGTMYPEAVGGNIYLKHITKSGITDEVIPAKMNDEQKSIQKNK